MMSNPNHDRSVRRRIAWMALLCAALPALAGAQTVQLAKTSQGGVGTFAFSLTNLDGVSDSITTTVAGTPTSSATVFTVTNPALPVALTEAANAQFSLDGASCVDTSGTVPGTIGTLGGNTLVIAPASLQPGVTLVCTFVNTQLAADLAITKQASPGVVATGGTVTYTLTASNVGVVDVTNAVVADVPGTGLSCTAAGSCSASGGATCPGSVPASALFGAGVTIPALPAGGSVAISVPCTVSASGN
jgi:uncharacterized repeat protein (TIGR01451 family)